MTTDWQDYQPHPHMALAQYSQGVPLARKPSNLGFGSNSIAGGASTVLVSASNQDQPGYQMVLLLTQTSVTATIPFASVTIKWTDSASGFTTVPKVFVLPCSSPTGTFFYINGPARMDTVEIDLKNLDPAQIVSYSFSYTQNSHPWTIDRCIECGINTVPQLTRPNGNPQDGILGSSSPTIAANSHVDRLATTWTGTALVSADNTGGTSAGVIQLLDPGFVLGSSTLYGTASSGIIWAQALPAGGQFATLCALPNGPVVMRISNIGASAAITPTVTLAYIDQ